MQSSLPKISHQVTLTGRFYQPGKDVVPYVGKVHLYDVEKKYLGIAKTDSSGNFSAQVTFLPDVKPLVIFRYVHEKKIAGEHEAIKKEPHLAKNLSFLRNRMETAEVVREVPFLTSRVHLGPMKPEESFEKEEVPLYYVLDILKAGAGPKAKSGWETFLEKIDLFHTHTIDDIEKSYGFSKVSLTAENTFKMLTNGVCPIYFKIQGDLLVAEVNFDRYEFDKLASLPNATLYFTKGEHKLTKIDLEFRKTLEPSALDKDKTKLSITADNVEFSSALRAANSAFHVFGQTVFHLGFGHVYGSHVAQTVQDYLVGTKLGTLLLPHCQFIRKISMELGKEAIYGESGVLNLSALSVNGISQLIVDALGSLDPFSFAPRKPFFKEHKFAMAEQLHYQIVSESVKEFLEKNREGIIQEWQKVHLFFYKLHRRLPDFRPWCGVDATKYGWQDASEIGGLADPSLPPRVDGKAFRLIAKSQKGPEASDFEMIGRFLTDFIFRVTLWHSWIHRSQYAAQEFSSHTMDLNFSPITINQMGKGPFGSITEKEAIGQLEIGSTFKNFPVERYSLIANPKVFTPLIERIGLVMEQYRLCGIDPEKELHFSTVI
jgi:hypothetical protein